MEFGIHLPSAQPHANAEDILEVALTAERLGLDAVWAFDHLFTPTGLASKYPYSRDGSYLLRADDPFFDPLALFGVLAGATKRIKIGAGVLIAAYRHPIVLSKILASIERFAPGRLVLGVGAGWMKEEFEAVGVPFERRGARLDEYLDALRVLWTEHPSRFEGAFYRWPEAGFRPAPSRPIPILVGGHTDRALERAARHGDGWAVVTGPGHGAGIDAIAARLEVLRAKREEAGRADGPFELLCQNVLGFDAKVDPRLPFVGPPEAIAESLRRFRSLGITMIDFVAFGPKNAILENAQRFVEEVRPLVVG